MGEAKRKLSKRLAEAETVMAVDTLGGRIQVQWDTEASATPYGQLAFFAEFLQVSGVFDAWVADCPLSYASPNAPDKREVLGTWLLSVLAGHRRYAHITGLRGDGVSPQVLGISRLISEDALRRALSRIDEATGTAWMRAHLMQSIAPALSTPWILDIDTTIKPLFGRQEDANIGYNPKKPGRPSHAYHSYWIGNLRLVLDVEVAAGDEHAASHALPGLSLLLDQLAPDQRPYLVRGDCGFGNDPVIREMEARDQRYLFKLRQSKNVQRLLLRQFQRNDWCVAGQGWEGVEDSLKLTGWERARRVVILRRPIKQEMAVARKRGKQMELAFPDATTTVCYEYAVLVSDCPQDIPAIAQLYRDRADSENGFDELKNQWGWGGFTTQDIKRCQLTARAVALIYNWWSWYARLAYPKARLEAITSRPLLLAAVGRTVKHAGQSRLYLTPLHAAGESIVGLIANIRAGLQHVKQAAEQLAAENRWHVLVRYIVEKITTPLLPTRNILPNPATG
jgi:hypothetical protein